MDHDPRPPATDVPAAGSPKRTFLEVVDENGHLPDDASQPPALRSRKRLALILFVATCASTFVVGMYAGWGLTPFVHPDTGDFLWEQFFAALGKPELIWNGLQYSAAVIGILLTHEMGHYLQARRHHVPATLPYFIPMPLIPFGTMGAVIVQGAGFADRRKLFDIAISGPLAGLVIAIPVTWMGVRAASVEPLPSYGVIFNDPLLIRWIAEWIHPEYGPGLELTLNPLLFAGWVGIFVTALNLIPVGQLDGGHILYTLIGKPAHYVALGVLGVAIVAMFWFEYPAFALLIVLLVLMGPRHPPTADDTVPLGPVRIALGWLTLAFVLIGFTPQPIIQLHGGNEEPPAATAEANP